MKKVHQKDLIFFGPGEDFAAETYVTVVIRKEICNIFMKHCVCLKRFKSKHFSLA